MRVIVAMMASSHHSAQPLLQQRLATLLRNEGVRSFPLPRNLGSSALHQKHLSMPAPAKTLVVVVVVVMVVVLSQAYFIRKRFKALLERARFGHA